ncbi:hypothetical protein B0H14DRAFT_3481231 [Mycena olivaceomarginata]|nr:hypothetical protein B0H14DRAFT_3481231 [Mycena olivaceomarginata]
MYSIVSTLPRFPRTVLRVVSTPRVLYLSGYHTLFDSFRVPPRIPTYDIRPPREDTLSLELVIGGIKFVVDVEVLVFLCDRYAILDEEECLQYGESAACIVNAGLGGLCVDLTFACIACTVPVLALLLWPPSRINLLLRIDCTPFQTIALSGQIVSLELEVLANLGSFIP